MLGKKEKGRPKKSMYHINSFYMKNAKYSDQNQINEWLPGEVWVEKDELQRELRTFRGDRFIILTIVS